MDSEGFQFCGGQYLFICLPELSMFEWHPFSISSAPHEQSITLHVRALGNWTRALLQTVNQAGGTKDMKIWWEGPLGNAECDIWGERYKSFLMVSGGIGITPLQAVTNQLTDQCTKGRPLTQIKFVWAVSDKSIMNAMYDPREGLPCGLPIQFQPHLVAESTQNCQVLSPEYYLTRTKPTEDTMLHEGSADTTQRWASEEDCIKPHLRYGRPDLKALFAEVKEKAIQAGDERVAVMVCGPIKMIREVVQLCATMSDGLLVFDSNEEIFEL